MSILERIMAGFAVLGLLALGGAYLVILVGFFSKVL